MNAAFVLHPFGNIDREKVFFMPVIAPRRQQSIALDRVGTAAELW